MAATDNNVRVPDELLQQARSLAEAEGCTADDVAADALKRYFEIRRNVRDLESLASWGEHHACERGFEAADVERALSEMRHGR